MSIGYSLITNGPYLGDFRDKIIYNHNLSPAKIDDDRNHCPIIIASGKNKWKMCCKSLKSGNTKCYLHRKKKLPIRNINYRQCCHIHNCIHLPNKTMDLQFSNFQFCQQILTCNIHTRNRNGLCNFHHHLPHCPCPKHNITNQVVPSSINNSNSNLNQLLYMEDIYDNISKYVTINTIKIIRCIDTQLSTKSLEIKVNPFTNINEKNEIILYIRLHLKRIENEDLTLIDKKILATNIFDYLINNKKFIFHNPKFAITVYNKLLEFKKDKQFDNIEHYIQSIFYQ